MGKAYNKINQNELAIKYLKKGLAVAQKYQLNFAEFKSVNNLGHVYGRLNQSDSAEVYLLKALDIQIRLGNKRKQGEVLTNLANNAGSAQQRDKAFDYYDRALALFQEVGNVRYISAVYRDIGTSHFFSGDYPKTIDSFQKALAALEGSQHFSHIIKTLDFLSEAYTTIEDYDNALLYLERASNTWREAYGERKNSEFSFKKGKVWLLKKEYKTAKYFLLESLAIKKETGQFVNPNLYQSLGESYEELIQVDSALYFYEKAIDIASGSKNFFIHALSLSGLARIYQEKGNINKAQDLYQKAYSIAQKNGIQERQMDAANGLYAINKAQKNYKTALAYLELSLIHI